MNKLMISLVLMVSAAFSGAFAIGFNGDVSLGVSEPSQLIVDVGSGESTMFTLETEKKSMLISNKLALGRQGLSYPQSYTLSSYRTIGKDTGLYISYAYASPNVLKRLTG